ncbi:hypothetical protein AYI68_g2806 [Smittium mucronatum]|uniref:Uncharacterized protein n=1 Tax=Smittium mucronatum TaxID=133383 RepID=A0A1R0H1R6_9FUNG|nr:hypothetical protein AYI68_g2806 [Smittium mucronatum]
MELITKYQEEDRSFVRAYKKSRDIDNKLGVLMDLHSTINDSDFEKIRILIKNNRQLDGNKELAESLDFDSNQILARYSAFKSNSKLSLEDFVDFFAQETEFFVDSLKSSSNSLVSKLDTSQCLAEQAVSKISKSFQSRSVNSLSTCDPQLLLKELSFSLKKSSI